MKYKEGDIVTIGANLNSHGFKIKEKVRIKSVRDQSYIAEHLDSRDWWCINDKEIKGYKEPIPLTAKQFLLSRYLPGSSEEDRELWYNTQGWPIRIVEIMEEYKNQ